MAGPDATSEAMVVACRACGTKNRKNLLKAERPVCARCGVDLPRGGGPVAADEGTFDAVLRAAPVPVLVDFWAAWCGPCRAFAPVLEAFAGRHPDEVLVLKVDTERHPGLAARFGISAIPTSVLFRGPAEVSRQSGALGLPALEKWVLEGRAG